VVVVGGRCGLSRIERIKKFDGDNLAIFWCAWNAVGLADTCLIELSVSGGWARTLWD
jgi:hypothetical protein